MQVVFDKFRTPNASLVTDKGYDFDVHDNILYQLFGHLHSLCFIHLPAKSGILARKNNFVGDGLNVNTLECTNMIRRGCIDVVGLHSVENLNDEEILGEEEEIDEEGVLI